MLTITLQIICEVRNPAIFNNLIFIQLLAMGFCKHSCQNFSICKMHKHGQENYMKILTYVTGFAKTLHLCTQ